MADEDKDKDEKYELVPAEEYEVLDQADDRAIIQMMTGQAIQDYVYSFKQGGRTVEGLTLAGINEAANRRGGISVEDIQFEEREDSWIAIVKATDTYTGSSRYGAFEQPQKSGGRDDPFAFTKAIHKAQRNAVKQLLPVPIIREVLNYYLHGRKPTSIEPQISLPTEIPKAIGDKVDRAQRTAFTVASRLKERLEQQSISQTDFWGYVKRRYNVASRNDMTESQWTQLAKELSVAENNPESFKELITQVRQVAVAQADVEVIAEEAIDKDSQEAESEKNDEDDGKPHNSLF